MKSKVRVFEAVLFGALAACSWEANAATFIVQPPSQLAFSGTFAGQGWQPQDPAGLSFLAPVSGEIDATWEGEELVIDFGSLVVGMGLWVNGFPEAGTVPGAVGTTLNYAGLVDSGSGFVIASTTYDFELIISGGRLSTSGPSEDVSAFTLSGTSNYAAVGSLGAQATSLAGGSASRIEGGAVTRRVGEFGETIGFDLTVEFAGVTNFGGNQVPFTLAYSGPIEATAVPEPKVGLLVVGGILMMTGRRRMKA